MQTVQLDQEIDRTIERLCRNGVTQRLSEDATRRILAHFADRLHSAIRSEALLSIRSAEEAAEAWGVSVRRAQAHIAWLNERYGVGARIGRAWLITEDEISRHRPGPPGRPAGGDDDVEGFLIGQRQHNPRMEGSEKGIRYQAVPFVVGVEVIATE